MIEEYTATQCEKLTILFELEGTKMSREEFNKVLKESEFSQSLTPEQL